MAVVFSEARLASRIREFNDDERSARAARVGDMTTRGLAEVEFSTLIAACAFIYNYLPARIARCTTFADAQRIGPFEPIFIQIPVDVEDE